MSHRKSNEDDLKLKYDYFYSLASKVLSEARMLMAKRKNDPDRTLMSYMQDNTVINVEHEYVLDSDYSSENELEEKLQGLSELDEEDLQNLNSESVEEDHINEKEEEKNGIK